MPDSGNTTIPLCVDLDGTVIKTDLLYESFLALVRQDFIKAVKAVFILIFQGRAAMKRFIAENVVINVNLLPLHSEVVAYIKREKNSGRKIYLVTASEQNLAELVANHLSLFSEVIGTKEINLKGKNKAKYLTETFSSFEYIGDSRADFAVFQHATEVGFVVSSKRLLSKFKKEYPQAKIFNNDDNSNLYLLARVLRLHQWVKNLLLFLPIIMAHKITELQAFSNVILAFFCFSLTASSVYIFNDLLDLENDRQHQSKKKRPFASGEVMPQYGLLLAILLLLTSSLLCLVLPSNFSFILMTYFIITTLYSFFLKRIVVLDILVLATLYTVRIIAGGAAADIPVSQWLLAFSMFVFLSLACVKRFSELLSLTGKEETAKGRGYRVVDREQVAIFGASSGYLSVLVLALYISSPAVTELYSKPNYLWLICPIVLFWITRIWFLARRDEVHEDPIVFALHDRTSYVVLVSLIFVILLAL